MSNTVSLRQTNRSYKITVDELIRAYYKLLMHKLTRHSELLFPLSKSNIRYASALFLTTYEVNLIEQSFIYLWKDNRGVDWVQVNSLLAQEYHTYRDTVRYFFTNNEVHFEEYFHFVCIFMFFNYESIFSLMVVIAGIYSNIHITGDQLKSFISLFSLFNDFCDEVTILSFRVNRSTEYPNGCYSMKNIRSHIEYSDSFKDYIECFRDELSRIVFGTFLYERIRRKIDFYYSGSVFLQNESCMRRWYRILFTDQESEFSYDYSVRNPNITDLHSLVNEEKLRFGYGSRSYNSKLIRSILN